MTDQPTRDALAQAVSSQFDWHNGPEAAGWSIDVWNLADAILARFLVIDKTDREATVEKVEKAISRSLAVAGTQTAARAALAALGFPEDGAS